VYKTKGHRVIAMPLCPLVWLPQQFTAPCRNQTGDSAGHIAMRVPAKNIRESVNSRHNMRVLITALLVRLQNRQRSKREDLKNENESDDQ
jgi:hypothetical protein